MRVLCAFVLAILAIPSAAIATPLVYGGTYSLALTNAPIDYTGSLTLDGTAKNLFGAITVSEQIVNDTPNSVWVLFNFSTDGPLAGNTAAFWEMNLASLPLTSTGEWDNFFLYWSVNGTPVNPIYPFGSGSLGYTGTNPVNPALSPSTAVHPSHRLRPPQSSPTSTFLPIRIAS